MAVSPRKGTVSPRKSAVSPRKLEQKVMEHEIITPVSSSTGGGSSLAKSIIIALLALLVSIVAVEKHDLHNFLSNIIIWNPNDKPDGMPLSPHFAALEKWVNDGGANSSSLYLKQYTDQIRGVVTRHYVEPHQVIMSMPMNMTITHEMGFTDTKIGQCLTSHNDTIMSSNGSLGLTIYMLETMEDPSNIFQPYYKTLPNDMSNIPVVWGADKLSWLQGSPTVNAIRDRAEQLRNDYERVNELCPDFSRFSYERYLHVRTTVGSRCFGIEKGGRHLTIMVPHCDMLNHKRPRDSKWKYNAELDQFQITTRVPMDAGTQATISYGDKSNRRFFINYGFAIEFNRDEDTGVNVNDLYMNISLAHVTEDLEALIDAKTKIQGDENLSEEFKMKMGGNEKGVLWAFRHLRLLAANEKDMVRIEKKPRTVKYIVSRRNEAASLVILANSMKAQLAGYANTFEENMKLKQSGTVAIFSDRYVALLVVISEQEIANHWIRVAEVIVPLMGRYDRENLAIKLERLPRKTLQDRDVYEYGKLLANALLAQV